MSDAVTIYLGECLERMQEIETGSVDMVMADLPYGTTACKWDAVIPFAPLWEQYRRVCKKNAAIVLTASQPFTSALVMSNVKDFKYCWTWNKVSVTGFANAAKQPLRCVEDVVVFYASPPAYNPQGLIHRPVKRRNSATVGGATLKGEHFSNGIGSLRSPGLERTQEHTNFPKNLLSISRERGLHPTQKPVALMEYLIRTYTNEGETVLDNTMGSGTTGVACINTGRKFIGIERDQTYFEIASKRLAAISAVCMTL